MQVHTFYSCFANTTVIALLRAHSTVTFLSALRLICALIFALGLSFFWYLHSRFTFSFYPLPLFVFSLHVSHLLLPAHSLNLQSRLWSAAVRCKTYVPARCAPAARSEAVLWRWWRWRRSPSSLGLASLNTLGSSTCFLSERRRRYGRCVQRQYKIPGAGIILCSCKRVVFCPLQEGGVSGFLHSFIAEVFAMVRAHVGALGGNAVVSFSMKECVFMENPNKNQVLMLHITNRQLISGRRVFDFQMWQYLSVHVVLFCAFLPLLGSVSHQCKWRCSYLRQRNRPGVHSINGKYWTDL